LDDPASVQAWNNHAAWLERHRFRDVERHRWSGSDWDFARELADTAWELHPCGLYLYAAERAVRDVEFLRGRRWLKEA
jgi:hypothetical protein